MNVTFGKSDSGAAQPKQIRFVHNQGHPPSKRRRINAACLTCRRRKTRCDGERPICSTCTKNGHKCLGYPEDTKRDGDPADSRYEQTDDHDQDTAAAASSSHQHFRSEPDSSSSSIQRASWKADQQASSRDASTLPSSSMDTRRRQSTSQPNATSSAPINHNTQRAPANMANPATVASAGHEQSPSMSSSHPPQTSSTDDFPSSPTSLRRNQNSHRIPYFRYFGPTAIVPGFKQMVVSIRDRRMSASAGSHPATSPLSNNSAMFAASSVGNSDATVEDLPTYDPNSPGPVHHLITDLVKAFFTHVGCNFPFLKESKILRHVEEKRSPSRRS
ncbi:hypothetical protein NQ176_g10740 [Zarea fungicola]|uniref:Uncharacterized protein n=1 Tax=Zarea fungicola TaxID=93591 RepID=A0ACC1MG04_9HYPO|nr:hypothetical protein NQ176_g10740 [Lecanicillium fungicola]